MRVQLLQALALASLLALSGCLLWGDAPCPEPVTSSEAVFVPGIYQGVQLLGFVDGVRLVDRWQFPALEFAPPDRGPGWRHARLSAVHWVDASAPNARWGEATLRMAAGDSGTLEFSGDVRRARDVPALGDRFEAFVRNVTLANGSDHDQWRDDFLAGLSLSRESEVTVAKAPLRLDALYAELAAVHEPLEEEGEGQMPGRSALRLGDWVFLFRLPLRLIFTDQGEHEILIRADVRDVVTARVSGTSGPEEAALVLEAAFSAWNLGPVPWAPETLRPNPPPAMDPGPLGAWWRSSKGLPGRGPNRNGYPRGRPSRLVEPVTVPSSLSASPDPASSPAAAPTAPQRPGGVTFAGVAAIVYGVLGIVTGILITLMSWFFWLVFWPFTFWMGPPRHGLSEAALMGFAPFLGVPVGIVAVAGIVGGIYVLQGRDWARWTLVLLYVAGAATFLGSVASGVSLVLLAVNVVALAGLLNKEATAWFQASQGAR